MTDYAGQKLFLLFLPLYYLTVVVYAFFGIFVYSYAENVPFDLDSKVMLSSVSSALVILLVSAASYIIGWLISYKILSNKNRSNSCSNRDFKPIYFNINVRKYFLLMGFLLPLLYIAAYGAGGLIERVSYTRFYGEDTRNETLLKIYTILMPFVIIGIGFIQSPPIRYILFIINFLVLLSASTRLAGLMVFLYGLGRYIKNDFRFNYKIFIIMVFSLYVFIGIFAIRNTSPQGLLYNIDNLFFSSSAVFELFFEGLNYILSFSVYVLAYSIEHKNIDWYSFFVSISPLSLSFHDANKMLDAQTLIAGVPAPMSAISILYSAGLLFGFLCYFILGFTTFMISKNLNKNPVIYLIILFLVIVSTLFSLQYNLRGMLRFMYLALFIYFGYRLYLSLKIRK